MKSVSRLMQGCVCAGVGSGGQGGAVGDCLPVALQL